MSTGKWILVAIGSYAVIAAVSSLVHVYKYKWGDNDTAIALGMLSALGIWFVGFLVVLAVMYW
jgi:hypothetical protein